MNHPTSTDPTPCRVLALGGRLRIYSVFYRPCESEIKSKWSVSMRELSNNTGVRAAVAEIGKSWPGFLDRIDDEPEEVRRALLSGVYAYLIASLPPAFRWFPEDRRHDLAVETALSLAAADFRKVRTYRDRGGRFASWLLLVANNHAKDVWRRERKMVSVDEVPEPPRDRRTENDPAAKLDADRIRAAILEMGRRCRLILIGRLDRGWSNRDLCRLFPDPGVDNKVVGNWYRECRLKLVEKLRRVGIRPEDFFEPAAAEGEAQ